MQRTIKRAELTAFLSLPRKVSGPIKVHVDNNELLMGYGEEKENVSNQSITEAPRRWPPRPSFSATNCRQVKGFRSLTGRASHPNGSAAPPPHLIPRSRHAVLPAWSSPRPLLRYRRRREQKQEQCWTRGLWQEREEVHAALQCAASFHCLMEEWKDVKSSGRSQKNSGISWIK